MFQEVQDLQDEGATLKALLARLSPEEWMRPTPFKSWTSWDVVGHLHLSDLWAMAALDGPETFKEVAEPAIAALRNGTPLRDVTRTHFAGLDGAGMFRAWSECFETLATRFSALDPKARLTWFGPDMGARMFVTARYMETWAHGQDIYDLLGQERVYTDAIRAIATIGVKTFAAA